MLVQQVQKQVVDTVYVGGPELVQVQEEPCLVAKDQVTEQFESKCIRQVMLRVKND